MSPDTDPHGHHPAGDSAGVPWEGRRFQENRHSDDDGSADPQLLAALSAFREGRGDQVAVVEAYRNARLPIPPRSAGCWQHWWGWNCGCPSGEPRTSW